MYSLDISDKSFQNEHILMYVCNVLLKMELIFLLEEIISIMNYRALPGV